MACALSTGVVFDSQHACVNASRGVTAQTTATAMTAMTAATAATTASAAIGTGSGGGVNGDGSFVWPLGLQLLLGGIQVGGPTCIGADSSRL